MEISCSVVSGFALGYNLIFPLFHLGSHRPSLKYVKPLKYVKLFKYVKVLVSSNKVCNGGSSDLLVVLNSFQ